MGQGHTPWTNNSSWHKIATDRASNSRRESLSESSWVVLWWGIYCFHSCSLNISQPLVHSICTLENHLIHFRANSVGSWCPEGQACVMKMNVSCKVSGWKQQGLFPNCEGGQLEVRKSPGMLMSRCVLSILLQFLYLSPARGDLITGFHKDYSF